MPEGRRPELRLVDTLLDVAYHVSPLDLVGDVDGFALVVRPAHLPEREEYAQVALRVLVNEGGIDRAVPIRSGADEVDDGNIKEVRAL